jgi:FAD/FMN-containing dehydrogenase
LRAHGQPIADIVQVKDYVAQQAMLDATVPNGMHYYWKSEFLPGMSAELFDAFNARFDGLEAPSNQILFFHMGGATNEHDEDDGAVGNRDAQFACVIQAMWPPDSPAGAANREWVHEAWQAIKPFSTGGNYINFQTDDESDERTHESYRGNYERLARVKTKYDPTNLFRVNRNIAPATR